MGEDNEQDIPIREFEFDATAATGFLQSAGGRRNLINCACQGEKMRRRTKKEDAEGGREVIVDLLQLLYKLLTYKVLHYTSRFKYVSAPPLAGPQRQKNLVWGPVRVRGSRIIIKCVRNYIQAVNAD